MVNAAEGASASARGTQNEPALARQLPRHHHLAYFGVCIGAELRDCGYFAAQNS